MVYALLKLSSEFESELHLVHGAVFDGSCCHPNCYYIYMSLVTVTAYAYLFAEFANFSKSQYMRNDAEIGQNLNLEQFLFIRS